MWQLIGGMQRAPGADSRSSMPVLVLLSCMAAAVIFVLIASYVTYRRHRGGRTQSQKNGNPEE